jgi:sugar diacid utilization regulator
MANIMSFTYKALNYPTGGRFVPSEHFNGSLIRREPELYNVQNTEAIIHQDKKKDKTIDSKLPKLHLCEIIKERGEKNMAFRVGNGAATTHCLHQSYSATALKASKTSSKQTPKLLHIFPSETGFCLTLILILGAARWRSG